MRAPLPIRRARLPSGHPTAGTMRIRRLFRRGATVVVLLASGASAPAAEAGTFTVTNTGNSGGGSLRQAITDANTAAGADTIAFNIPSAGPYTISPTSALPTITGTATVDGTTQPGFSGTPIIELDGTLAGSTSSGLTISAADTTVRGLVINRFGSFGINAFGNGAVIRGNYIGTDLTGTLDRGNLNQGISLGANSAVVGGSSAADRNVISGNNVVGLFVNGSGHLIKGNRIGTDVSGTNAVPNSNGIQVFGGGIPATNNTIGGPAVGEGNLISGNTAEGILLNTIGLDKTQFNVIQGNYIGTDAAGTGDVGNGGSGVGFGASSGVGRNTVGGSAPGAANVIAFNGVAGVSVESGTTREDIAANSIFENTGLGIDIGSTGVTANDTGDADSGANNLQNFPVLTAASSAGGATNVTGFLNSVASKSYRIDYYSSPTCDTSGNGEGKTFLGSASRSTDATGNGSVDATVPTEVSDGHFVTATATDPDGNTSEFSTCVGATNTGGTVGGADEFEGSDPDPDVWATTNAVRWCTELTLWRNLATESCAGRSQQTPPGNTTVTGGLLKLSGEANTLAFPYLWTKNGLFGTSGDFVLEVRAKYDEIKPNGDGFHMRPWADATPSGSNSPIPTGEDTCGSGRIWSDVNVQGPRATLVGNTAPVPNGGTAFHTYTFEYVDGKYALFVDGSLLIGPIASSKRADRLWLGNGVFWSLGVDWSDTSFDYVRISQPATIDADNDGVRDSAETPVNVRPAALQDSDEDGLPDICDPTPPQNGTIVIQKNTDPDATAGEFTFTGAVPGAISDGETLTASVSPGTHNVTESAKAGWGLTAIDCDDSDSTGSTDTRTATVRVASNETVTCEFTNHVLAQLTGTKFNDFDDDGTLTDDPGLANWTIRAYRDSNADGTLQAGETSIAASDITAANGSYELSLSPGSYVLCEVAKSGWEQTAPSGVTCDALAGLAPGGHALTVSAGAQVAQLDFGNRQPGVVDCAPPDPPEQELVPASPPADLHLDEYMSNECMFLFAEQQDVVLEDELAVDSSPVRGGSPATLPPGSVVSSHLVHADSIGDALVEFKGSHTFDDPVIGIIRTGPLLFDSNVPVGIPTPEHDPGLDYEPDGFLRQLEADDRAEVVGDGRTVEFELSVSTAHDDVRILTGSVPDQAVISGVKFRDSNASGQADGDPVEPGLQGWVIRAYEDDGDEILEAGEPLAASDTTDSGGAYSLTVEAGDYIVCEVAKDGWEQTAPTGGACDAVSGLAAAGHIVSLEPGVQLSHLDFGNRQPGVVDCVPPNPPEQELVVATPPANLQIEEHASDDCMFLFPEQEDVLVGEDGVEVDRSPVRSGNPATLPEGSVLSSFIVHADRIGDSLDDPVQLKGSHTFEDEVVGLVLDGQRLLNTDSDFGIPKPDHDPGLDYEPDAGSRGFDNDQVSIEPDGHTVKFDFQVTGAIDEVRVLTGTVPDPPVISGSKFHDIDGDAVWDEPDEPGLPGWTIRAYEDDGDDVLESGEELITSDTTDEDGAYSLTVEAGDYIVCEVAQDDWVQMFPTGTSCAGGPSELEESGHAVTVTAGEGSQGHDFGNFEPAVVDCVPPDPPEQTLVVASPPANLQIDKHVSDKCMFLFPEREEVVVGEDGVLVDESRSGNPATLPEGSVLSSFIVHADKIGSTLESVPLKGSHTFEDEVVGLVLTGDNLEASDVDFGIPRPTHDPGLDYEPDSDLRGVDDDQVSIQPDGHTVVFDLHVSGAIDEVRVLTGTVPDPPVISGSKFHDIDGDGIWDEPEEPGLPGWTIDAYEDDGDDLLEAGEGLIKSTTTGEDGSYSLTVEAGDYIVCEVAQPGWEQTAPAGTACAEGPDGLEPAGHAVTVIAGEESPNHDFGNRRIPAVISGVKFEDRNDDGDQDQGAGESGLDGWTVRAYVDENNDGDLDAGETELRDASSTGSDGSYSLEVDPDDDYVVCEVGRTNWVQTAPKPLNERCGTTVTELEGSGHWVSPAPGETVGGRDFGNFIPVRSISKEQRRTNPPATTFDTDDLPIQLGDTIEYRLTIGTGPGGSLSVLDRLPESTQLVAGSLDPRCQAAAPGVSCLLTNTAANATVVLTFSVRFIRLDCGVIGTRGNNNLTGTGAAEVICGGGGGDNISALGRDDTVYGDQPLSPAPRTTPITNTAWLDLNSNGGNNPDPSDPSDAVRALPGPSNDGPDVISAGSGHDRVFAQDDNDTVNGNVGRDALSGDDGNDVVSGDESDDTVIGGNGEDLLRGNDENDLIEGNAGQDLLEGGFGADQLFGGASKDALLGGPDKDRLAGGGGESPNETADDSADFLSGGDGKDLLLGQGGSDTNTADSFYTQSEGPWTPQLQGGLGVDSIHGGVGNDQLDGGPGGLSESQLAGNVNNILFGGDGASDFCSNGPLEGSLYDGTDRGDIRDPTCELLAEGQSTKVSKAGSVWRFKKVVINASTAFRWDTF